VHCSKCGSTIGKSDLFCAKCGTAVSIAGAKATEAAVENVPTLGRGPKQLSRVVFVTFILGSTFVAALVLSEKGIGTVLLSALVAERFAGTAVAFYIAKLITKNVSRTWIDILFFQVINVIAGLFSAGASGSTKTAMALGFAFIASALVFWLRRFSYPNPVSATEEVSVKGATPVLGVDELGGGSKANPVALSPWESFGNFGKAATVILLLFYCVCGLFILFSS